MSWWTMPRAKGAAAGRYNKVWALDPVLLLASSKPRNLRQADGEFRKLAVEHLLHKVYEALKAAGKGKAA